MTCRRVFVTIVYMHIEKLHLKKTKNMRDMGGFPAADGRKIKHCRLIRSGRLYKLPKSTVKALADMKVDSVIDMRTEKEIEEHTPTILEGVNYYYIPLVCTATPGITAEGSMARTMLRQSKRIKEEFGTAERYIAQMYEYILFEPGSRAKLKEIFDILEREQNCVVFHCNSGKDRTGLLAMLIEGALGVDRELIVEDYMASRRFQLRRRTMQKIGLFIMPIPLRFKRLLRAMMDTKPQYITDVLDEIDRRYGSITGYLKEGLGVDERQIAALKENYLE